MVNVVVPDNGGFLFSLAESLGTSVPALRLLITVLTGNQDEFISCLFLFFKGLICVFCV